MLFDTKSILCAMNAHASIQEQEEMAINLILQGEKKQFAIRRAGLSYTSRTVGYRRIVRAAGNWYLKLVTLLILMY